MSFQYALTDKPEIRPFEPVKTAVQKYPITSYQPVYYVAESFADAREKIKWVPLPFKVKNKAFGWGFCSFHPLKTFMGIKGKQPFINVCEPVFAQFDSH